MTTARQSEREARRLFRLCIIGGNLDENRVRLVTQALLQSKRRGYLLLLRTFLRLLKHEYTRRTAEIESAMPLPADLLARTQARLAELYGPDLTPQFTHNPDLIGGMRIKVGSDVYDGSIRSGLDALARRFTRPNGRHVAG